MSRYYETITDAKLELLARSVRKLSRALDEAGRAPESLLAPDELEGCMALSAAYPEPPSAAEGHHD